MSCNDCPLVQCDFLDPQCRLLDGEVFTLRPDLVKPPPPRQVMDKRERYYGKNRDKYREWNRINARNYRARLREGLTV